MNEGLIASMWWCQDQECDCTQPIVELTESDGQRRRVWEGEFESGYGGRTREELAAQWKELIAAADRLGAKKAWNDEDLPAGVHP